MQRPNDEREPLLQQQQQQQQYQQKQQQQQQYQYIPYQEDHDQRLDDLDDIQTQVSHVNDLFQSLSGIVQNQQFVIDHVGTHLDNTLQNTANAQDQLVQAHRHQRSANKCKSYIFVVLLVIVLILAMVGYLRSRPGN